MADAVRLISIRKGYDPREFALVVFGGAGPLHGAELAKELKIPTVIVPPNPGVTSALGCLLVDIRHDLSEMYSGGAAEVEPGRSRRRSRGSRRRRARCSTPRASPRTACASRARSTCATSASGARCRSRSEHRSSRSTRSSRRSTPSTSASTPTAATTRRSRSTSSTCARSARPRRPSSRPRRERRRPRADRHARGRLRPRRGRGRGAGLRPDDLPAGAAFEGPALIDQLDSTVLVPPGVEVEVDEWLNIRMQIEQEDES